MSSSSLSFGISKQLKFVANEVVEDAKVVKVFDVVQHVDIVEIVCFLEATQVVQNAEILYHSSV